MLRRSAREFLAKECGPKVVRRVMESADGYDAALWKKIAGLGWTALGIPEEYGGGGTVFPPVLVLGGAGPALLPRPFFSPKGAAGAGPVETWNQGAEEEGFSGVAAG